mmetsp:Transcript_7401/g.14042  ORF Transcript_7401/g.14042 Transcript_7401/m.14042 type:complete len:82 (+) Transcript_7401:227-472(+)
MICQFWDQRHVLKFNDLACIRPNLILYYVLTRSATKNGITTLVSSNESKRDLFMLFTGVMHSAGIYFIVIAVVSFGAPASY